MRPASFVCNVTSATSTVVKGMVFNEARSRTREHSFVLLVRMTYACPFDSFVVEINHH